MATLGQLANPLWDTHSSNPRLTTNRDENIRDERNHRKVQPMMH